MELYEQGYEDGYEEGYEIGSNDARKDSYEAGFYAGVDSVIKLKDTKTTLKSSNMFILKTLIEYEKIFQKEFALSGEDFYTTTDLLTQLIEKCYLQGWKDRGSVNE